MHTHTHTHTHIHTHKYTHKHTQIHTHKYTHKHICVFTRIRYSYILYIVDTEVASLQLRLVDGSSELEGRLEILYYGLWGTICDDFFGITDANVACRRLGFIAARSYSTSVAAGRGSIWLDNVQCVGNETALEHCSHRGLGVSFGCSHYEDVGVTCISKYYLKTYIS